MWRSLSPELPVADVAAAQAWFRDVLGFEITYTAGEHFGAVQYGNTEIFLRRREPPWESTCCCVRVDDADYMYALYRERGAKVQSELATKAWHMREFTIEEPNGHLFRIGHSTR